MVIQCYERINSNCKLYSVDWCSKSLENSQSNSNPGSTPEMVCRQDSTIIGDAQMETVYVHNNSPSGTVRLVSSVSGN